MSKQLTESKKAQSTWIGALIIAVLAFVSEQFGWDYQTLLGAVIPIAALFGVQVNGQAKQDVAIEKRKAAALELDAMPAAADIDQLEDF